MKKKNNADNGLRFTVDTSSRYKTIIFINLVLLNQGCI